MKIKGLIFDFNRTLYDPDSGELVKGALELLEALKASRYKLALLCKESTSVRAKLISSLGLDEFFCYILMIEGNKKIRHIHQCLSIMQLNIWEVAVVGDRVEEEICVGNIAGAMTIWVKQGKFGSVEPTTEKQKPTHTVYNLQAVLGLV
jgi:phosphoglycolate phosphatase-like HAD superfamily hydrolase